MTPEEALTLAARELATAQHAFPPFRSPHEGYAILLEELDELWLEIKNDKRPSVNFRRSGCGTKPCRSPR